MRALTVPAVIPGGTSSANVNTLAGIDQQRINLAFSRIGAEECAFICHTLMDASIDPPIRSIDFTDNQLGPVEAEKITAAMETSLVEEVFIRFNSIGRAGCDGLATVLKISSKLRVLDLRGNRLQPNDVRKLVKGISLSTNLTYIGLHGNELGPEGTALLAASLEKNSRVVHVDLSKNDIGPQGAAALGKLLSSPSCVVQVLHVWGNRLGPGGFKLIMDAIAVNSSVTNLSMGNNHGTNESCACIGKALQSNDALRRLDLRSNSFSEQGMRDLCASAFTKTKSLLTSLSLSGNPIGSAGADILAKALINSREPSLASLDLWSCNLGRAGAIRISGLLAATQCISDVNLSGNAIDDEAAIALSKALVMSRSLTLLDLSNNSIGSIGASDILDAVQMNTYITGLLLHGNDINRVVQKKVDVLMAQRRAAGAPAPIAAS